VNPVDALYFSAVTITTVGYGDLSPEVWFGKLLVILEIFVGLILVVVAFQRVLGGFEPPAVVECQCCKSQSPDDKTIPTDS
jgi:voltage-gated potassium channel Kch